jgi:hypothetical protein
MSPKIMSSGPRILNTSSTAGKSLLVLLSLNMTADPSLPSLEKDPARRATPWRMADHPWMVEIRAKKVNMPQYLKQVWDWKD